MTVKWKDSEVRTFNLLKKHLPVFKDLEKCQNDRSVYDCFGPTGIVELKFRSKKHNHYEEVMLERAKARNMVRAIGGSKPIYYVSHLDDGVFVWEITKLAKEGYDFKWHERYCNTTTKFANRSKKKKEVGMLSRSAATYVITNTNDIMSGEDYEKEKQNAALEGLEEDLQFFYGVSEKSE